MEIAAESHLLNALGVRFIAFVLNIPEQVVSERFQSQRPLDAKREAALADLARSLATIEPGREEPPLLWQLQLGAFGLFVPALGTSVPTALHSGFGGSTDLPSARSRVDRLMLQFARDVYPQLLLPESPDNSLSILFPSLPGIYTHPAQADFEAAVLADRTLRQLFPNHDEHRGWTGSARRSTGVGASTQLWMFPDTVIRNAWHLARLEHTTPTLMQVANAVLAALQMIRRGLKGGAASVPVRVGLTGVLLESGTSLELPWGRLRPTQDSDSYLVPASLSGSATHRNQDGEAVVFSHSGDVVLETDLSYKVVPGEFAVGEDWLQGLRAFDTLTRRVESVQLGLLLASGENHSTTVWAWQAIFDPLGHGPSRSWRETNRAPRLLRRQLTISEADAWRRWIEDIDANRGTSIDVAISRTLRAVSERHDSTDALLDAVIAWENLVGADQGELTLRISASLAWLLEDTPADRATLQQRIKKLYGLRSKVVHGASVPSREIGKASNEARAIAIRALQCLIRERPELLVECKDSAARSTRLMLGG